MKFEIVLLLVVLACTSASKAIQASVSTCPSKNEKNGLHTRFLGIRGGSGSLPEGMDIDWRFFLAGGLCAATSHGITTPIDVVKTRMQTDPAKYTQGVFQAAKDIVATEGPGFLLAGLAPTVVGYGIEGALKFGAYESFKKIFANLTSSQVFNFLMASIIAGAIASIVLCPMEEARIKMVGDKSWASENLISGLLRLVKEGGILSTFGGFPAMLSKQVPYTMSKQVSFDVIATALYGLAAVWKVSKKDAKWAISIFAAFGASILACLGSQPGDVILTATYKGSGGHGALAKAAKSSSKAASTDGTFTSVVKSIYKEKGFGGFYLGLQARLMHVALIITSQLILYDIIKAAVGLPVTGSH